ncbi:unnamed protein product [Amoebophrya sp. A120]|nr:unnamed protein product [Amoebophrya sp. A120]|eukprot:GSA120T00022937001.1
MSVTLKTTLGDLKVELHCQKVPKSCKNFLALCASGMYKGTTFHRNIKQFIIQGGDTDHKNGKGGKAVIDESGQIEHEVKPDLKHDRRGILAFADTGKSKKIGSQFYLTYKRLPNLDGSYTVIGRLIDGFETLQKMEDSPVVDEKKARPVKDIVIEDVVVHANPIADEEGH